MSTREFAHSLLIEAPPAAILDAFFDPAMLAEWWQVKRALCTPRDFGVYAVEWEATERRDELLGRLGGILHGTVIEFNPGREFFLADVYWLPPEGSPLGPMALEATCSLQGEGTTLHLRHSGCDTASARWTRYYDVVAGGWIAALGQLKGVLERRPPL